MPAEWEPHSQCWMGWPVSILYGTLLDVVMEINLILAVVAGQRNVLIIGVTMPFMLNVIIGFELEICNLATFENLFKIILVHTSIFSGNFLYGNCFVLWGEVKMM